VQTPQKADGSEVLLNFALPIRGYSGITRTTGINPSPTHTQKRPFSCFLFAAKLQQSSNTSPEIVMDFA
jgi:hypothetical protein